MNEAGLIWQERLSESEFVASVWTCSTPVATTRTVLADPCISISLVKNGKDRQVVIRGPETKPHSELLASGYNCVTIRLQPGVLMQGFSVQKFIDSSLVLPVDVEGGFWLESARLQFPDFETAEVLIDQMHNLGCLRYGISNGSNAHAAGTLSNRHSSRLSKRATGLSPYQLYQLQRIHQALRLLKQGMPATIVAAELNFVDQSHLTRVSKQLLGYTPKQVLSLPQIP